MPWTKADVDKHKKGLTDKQKEQWVAIANSVRESCLKEGKSEEVCDGLAIQQANGAVSTHAIMSKVLQANKRYTLRKETKNGKTFIIAPVVMMVEGVHCGSHGCLLHPLEELSKFPEAWNGRPVVVYHPEKNGQALSAGNPDVDLGERVGTVYNTEVEGNKLKAEVWLEEDRLKEKSPDAYKYIQEGNPMDVSVGVFTDEEDKEGVWNGEKYIKIARNHRFDHLALLPNMEGACSWADGCGIRLNNKFNKGGKTMSENVKAKVDELIANNATHYSEDDREWLSKLDEAQLDKMAPKLQRNDFKPCCPDKVKELIANAKSPFTEDDKGWLERLSSLQLDKLFPKEEKKTETTTVVKEPELTKENLQKVFSQYAKAEDFIALAPKEMQGQLTSGLNTYRAERKKMVDDISANSKLTKEELEEMNDATLQKLYSSVVPEGNYSASGNVGGGNGNSKTATKEMKVMLGYTDKKE